MTINDNYLPAPITASDSHNAIPENKHSNTIAMPLQSAYEQQAGSRPIDTDVAASEKAAGFRNEAMASLTKYFRNFS